MLIALAPVALDPSTQDPAFTDALPPMLIAALPGAFAPSPRRQAGPFFSSAATPLAEMTGLVARNRPEIRRGHVRWIVTWTAVLFAVCAPAVGGVAGVTMVLPLPVVKPFRAEVSLAVSIACVRAAARPRLRSVWAKESRAAPA